MLFIQSVVFFEHFPFFWISFAMFITPYLMLQLTPYSLYMYTIIFKRCSVLRRPPSHPLPTSSMSSFKTSNQHVCTIDANSFVHVMKHHGKKTFQHLHGPDRQTHKSPNRLHHCCLHTIGLRYLINYIIFPLVYLVNDRF